MPDRTTDFGRVIFDDFRIKLLEMYPANGEIVGLLPNRGDVNGDGGIPLADLKNISPARQYACWGEIFMMM